MHKVDFNTNYCSGASAGFPLIREEDVSENRLGLQGRLQNRQTLQNNVRSVEFSQS
jgi:hypothetical protein